MQNRFLIKALTFVNAYIQLYNQPIQVKEKK